MKPVAIVLLLLLPLTPVAQESSTPPPAEPEATANTQAGGQLPATAADEAEATDNDGSPFDYEASEQISEDLSVSFPVDI
jgi:hypothetical protein